VKSYSICLLVTGLFCLIIFSRLIRVESCDIIFFLRLHSVPLYVCMYVFTHPSVNIWAASTSGLLWVSCCEPWVWVYLSKTVFNSYWHLPQCGTDKWQFLSHNFQNTSSLKIFFYCFIVHMCTQGLGHFSPLPPPPPLPPTPPPPSPPHPSIPSRNYFALISNFVVERV
jgi:hypothetical protein